MIAVPAATVELDALRSAREPVGTVAIPVRDQVHVSTMFSLLAMDRTGLPPIDLLIMRGSMLTLQRNALVQHMRGDWILFIDDDMVWAPDSIKRLLETKDQLAEQGIVPDILGGLCFRRQEPFQPTLYVRDGTEGPWNFLETWDTDIVDIDATGMAFALITKECLERLSEGEMPSYEERVAHDRHPDFFRWHGAVGEDLRFCSDVKALGGRIMVDTRIEIGHVGERVVWRRDFVEQLAQRPTDVVLARKQANDPMGLHTVTRAEAKELLKTL